MTAPPRGRNERLWRLRKDHTWIDARLVADVESHGVELQFFYDGTVVYARRWPSRAAALAAADERRAQLQRAGWNTHW
jgi:hypothetical protein